MGLNFQGRREDGRLVTGKGQYTADWNLPKQAYAVFLRSDRAHAKIRSVNVDAARAAKGVILAVTGEDIARENFSAFEVISFFAGKGGSRLQIPHRSALAHQRVRFVGEPVAMVVADTESAAIEACEAIAVEYEDLPVLVQAADALGKDAVQIHDGIPGNLGLTFEYGDQRATDEAFARAAHVVSVTLDCQRIAGNPMEPKSCLIAYDNKTSTFDVYAPSQGMNALRAGFAHIMNLPADKFRIHAKDVGGAFGVRNEVYPEYVAIAYAARALGRPVKWTGTRSETLIGDHHGRAAEVSGSLALDEKGNFLAQRIEWLVNLGAYCSEAGPLINTMGPAATPTNLYRMPAVHGVHQLVFTNTTPTTAYRGAGRPNVAYLSERLVDEAARVTGIDRVTLRRRNLLRKSDFPFTAPTKAVYDSGDPIALLDRALTESDWKGFAARRKASAKAGKLRGIGLATFVEPAGVPGKEEVALKFDPQGRIILYTVSGPSGQGHETAYPEIVSRILGLPAEQITLRYSDPDGPKLTGLGSIGSRSTQSHGASLAGGAQEIIRKARDIAANELEVAASDLEFASGRFNVPGTDLSIGLQDIIDRFAGNESHPLDTTHALDTLGTFPTSAQVSEVEIDPDTGVVSILNYVAVDDCGTVINHAIVEGQVTGGVIQGLGQVMGEQCVYDEQSGQYLTGTFMDYYMPRADLLTKLSIVDLPVPSPNNILGVKGTGESGTTGSVPCVANAVLDALSPLGIQTLDMPFTPYRVWHAIQSAGGVKR